MIRFNDYLIFGTRKCKTYVVKTNGDFGNIDINITIPML